MSAGTFAAVDLGASSGRVLLGRVGAGELVAEEVHRFANRPVRVAGQLCWDVLDLYRGTLDGLRQASARTTLSSIGIDSWAVDFGLLDDQGVLLGNPVHYRDTRTDAVVEQVLARVSETELYRITGIQLMPINTLFQLFAARETAAVRAAHRLALIPDLFGFWLTGELGAELTNASTTQLLDVHTHTWSDELTGRLGLPARLLPPLRGPGERIGTLRADVVAELGASTAVPVVAVGSHDTASAVVAVPARGPRFGYVSCGTWSLVGLELDRPVLCRESQAANFTNEYGVDDTVRYLRNVMGLWLLQESERTWRAAGWRGGLAELLREAARVEPFRAVIDVNAHEFLAPGDMPARIAAHCARTGQPEPRDRAEVARCVLDGLALAYRRTLREARELAGIDVDVLHIVGGGVNNELLCQLTADACGLPVVAGPVEAAALGNLMVQARSSGALSGDLGTLRALVRETQRLREYQPAGDEAAWRAAESRLADEQAANPTS